MPMALCADAVVKDGGLVGDPTEGALVVLAAKGGVDPALTREQYPRLAELPFDAAYKFMATFHAMKDEAGKDVIRCYVKGAPDQLLARASSAIDPDGDSGPHRPGPRAVPGGERATGGTGPARHGDGQRDFDPATFDPSADLLPLVADLELLALVGIVDPPRPEAKAAIAIAHSAGIQVRMITGDHAVTAEAIARELGIDGPRHHGRRVRGHGRRDGRARDRHHRCHRARRARGQGPPRGHPQAQGPHRGHDR